MSTVPVSVVRSFCYQPLKHCKSNEDLRAFLLEEIIVNFQRTINTYYVYLANFISFSLSLFGVFREEICYSIFDNS